MKSLRTPLLSALAGFALLSVGGSVLLTSGQMPYNVRELAASGNPVLRAALLMLALYGTFGTPALLAHWLIRGRWERALLSPLLVLGNGLLVWLSLRAAVPLEAIHDIVGSPILAWPWEWELLGRFLALFLAPCTLFMGAVIVWSLGSDPQLRASNVLLRWTAPAVVLLAVSHWVVVSAASTDNLTELMAGGGGPASALALGGWLFSLGLGGAALSWLATGPRRHALLAVLAILLSLPLGYWLFSLGTEQAVHKYDRVFSAIQFLLSTDRRHLAEGSALLFRYALALAGALCLIAITQHPFWLAWTKSSRPELPDRVSAPGAGDAVIKYLP